MRIRGCKVSRHGKKQLEIQLGCEVPDQERVTTYNLDVYLLFPKSMQMNATRYGVGGFLRDILSFTRFSSPAIPLRALTDPACDKSPLQRLLLILKEAGHKRELKEKRIRYELRTLANIHNDRLREGTARIRRGMRVGGVPADLHTQTRRLIRGSRETLRQVREELRPLFLEHPLATELIQALNTAEDAMSLAAEKRFCQLHTALGTHPELGNELLSAVREAQAFRRGRGFPVLDPEAAPQELEAWLRHESELKKWAQQTYYMTRERDRASRHLTSFCMAMAAMLAMTFAVIVTFTAGARFGENSIPFALALVISYAFKDRIKETSRAFFLHLLPRMVSDRRDLLISPDKNRVGASRIRVGFSTEKQLPPEMLALLKLSGDIPDFELPERDMLQFHKRIHLHSRRLRKTYSRLDAITEILRFRLDDWLNHMDDPQERVWCMEDDNIRTLKVNRIYPVKMMLRLARNGSEAREIFTYDLHLNRKGLVRVCG